MVDFDPLRYSRPRSKNYRYYALAVKTARQDYTCWQCEKEIKKGERYVFYREPSYSGLYGWAERPQLISRHVCLGCASGWPEVAIWES